MFPFESRDESAQTAVFIVVFYANVNYVENNMFTVFITERSM